MENQIYTSKSNATRAAKKDVSKQGADNFVLQQNADGWFYELTSPAATPLDDMVAVSDHLASVAKNFVNLFEGYKENSNSKCRSLRLTASEYNGDRKTFMKDAVAYGIKPATASANWAAAKRGEF